MDCQAIQDHNEPQDNQEWQKEQAHITEQRKRNQPKIASSDLLAFVELPQWLKDNEHLLHFHRPPMNSYRECFASVFYLHSETINVWSHLIGAVIFFVLWMIHLLSTKPYHEKISFSAFFFSAVLCMSCSSFMHITSCHSPEVASTSQIMDYVGIGVLVVGSFVPWVFYAFYCDLWVFVFYMASVSVMGVATVTILLHPTFQGPDYRPLRSSSFVALGLLGVVPAVHSFWVEGIWKSLDQLCIGWLTFMAMFYILGAAFYATRIPERFAPGKFDLVLNSHQLFHFAVLAGAMTEYIGITKLASYRHYCEEIGTCHCR